MRFHKTTLAFITMLAAAPACAYQYTITDLGTLGGNSGAFAISDNGYIVGLSDTSGGYRATLFNAGGDPTAFASGSLNPYAFALGVNNSGQAVGVALFDPPSEIHAAVFTPGGSAIDLGTLGGGGSQANAINNNGQIVGISSTFNNGGARATLFGIGSDPIDLGTLAGGNWSNATAINNAGQIVGASSSYWGTRATLFDSGTGPIDLDPTYLHPYSSATGINDSGQIVGNTGFYYAPNPDNYFQLALGSRATIFSINGIPIDLGDLGGRFSSAYGINSEGQIVGNSTLAGDRESHAALFGFGIDPIDLNDLIDPLSGWTLEAAVAINSAGAIVGQGRINGEIRAFLATPVPEPATLALLGLGLAGLGLTRRRRITELE